MVCSCPGTRKA
ncbi:hypothetical protein VCHC32A1_2029, partial [Vibrio cholerae HC-32A1]